MKYSYYMKPPIDAYLSAEESGEVCPGYLSQSRGESYTMHNYLKPGIVSYIKTLHFETALKLTHEYFYKTNVIDFGCADGAFIPSLAKYFNHVVAIDKELAHINVASRLVSTLGLDNVELICNNSFTIEDIRSKISDEKYHVLYLLETLEHIGDKDQLYESKINFLKEISALIDEEGIIVISVPNMIGISYLIQRIVSKPFGIEERPISKKNLFKACFLKDTTDLEEQWHGGHLGFNHKKLESYLKNEFRILEKKNIISQVVYSISRKVA